MPIYEYICSCGSQFEEIVVRSDDEAKVHCRACGGRDVKRQLSRPSPSPSGGRANAPARGCGPVG